MSVNVHRDEPGDLRHRGDVATGAHKGAGEKAPVGLDATSIVRRLDAFIDEVTAHVGRPHRDAVNWEALLEVLLQIRSGEPEA